MHHLEHELFIFQKVNCDPLHSDFRVFCCHRYRIFRTNSFAQGVIDTKMSKINQDQIPQVGHMYIRGIHVGFS